MTLANTLDAIRDHLCPNGCGALIAYPEMSRCPECGYYTNCTPEHLRKVAKRSLAADLRALGLSKPQDAQE